MLARLKSFIPPAPVDWLFPPDPSALRLLAALRATLAGALAFVLVILLGAIIVVPTADRILGFAIGLLIAVIDATLYVADQLPQPLRSVIENSL